MLHGPSLGLPRKEPDRGLPYLFYMKAYQCDLDVG